MRRLVKKLLPKGLFRLVEPYGHLAEAVLWQVIYGFPAKKLKIIGVTGTNGKTTTSFLIHKMLTNSGIKTGLMTTVAYGVDNDIKPQIQHMTTLPTRQLLKRLKELKSQGIDWLVLEVTSHGLAQNRVWGVPFSVAVMTNLTHEHLDYHGTFEKYRAAKLKLFKLANKNRRGLRVGIVNADDESGDLFVAVVKNPVFYGIEKGDIKATNVNVRPNGSNYIAEIGADSYQISCQLPGSFNVYNSLAAVAVGKAVGLSKPQIEQGIAALDSVEGRMTRIEEGQNFDMIVDFAHTPDSFEKLFKDLQPAVKGKFIVMFGSAGRRDEAKRAIQGELAGKFADIVVITEEDDRDVDSQAILEQIAEGAERAGKQRDKDLFLVHDRTEAINFAASKAKTGDTVLLLGKGHEKTIERADGEHPWDEIDTARVAARASRQ